MFFFQEFSVHFQEDDTKDFIMKNVSKNILWRDVWKINDLAIVKEINEEETSKCVDQTIENMNRGPRTAFEAYDIEFAGSWVKSKKRHVQTPKYCLRRHQKWCQDEAKENVKEVLIWHL